MGTLVLELRVSHDDQNTAAFIRWLYVKEDSRNQGVGSTLLDTAVRVLNEIGLYDILCDLTINEDCDLICAFLENFGFEFHFSELYQVMIPIAKIKKLAARLPKANSSSFVHPLSAVSQEKFAEFVIKMKEIPEVLADLPETIEAYDGIVSCLTLSDTGAIKGMLLITEDTDGCPTIFLLRMLGGNSQGLAEMLTYSINQAALAYLPKTYVRANCWYPGAAHILNSLFPSLELALVRRGHFNAIEDD